ncbi:hypothetical protein SteCoe_31813 [Stentor coeruleus]|uniref:Probable threonine--tRNA ligase, cytoplasmic n=1 Tax=Stentor coeruleus TaxID=5963 RepID=A0A1R2B0I0_9CILI|nr:hypothetical protein SteCoe_31813 [Stentor coeruleus]
MQSEPNKRANLASGPEVKASTGKIGGPYVKQENAAFLESRTKLYDSFHAKYLEKLNSQPAEQITISLPNGTNKTGISFKTTPLDIAKDISRSLAERVIVAKVKFTRRLGFEDVVCADEDHEEEKKKGSSEYELYDLTRPLEGDCELQLLSFDDPEGKVVFWHSSAHILGASLEKVYGSQLCIGPPLNPGFFYDSYMGDMHITQENYQEINKAAEGFISKKHPFQRIILTKEEALELFAYNPFKVQLISNKIPDGGKTTAYRCGHLIDLCTGPHVVDTGKIKAFSVTNNSSAYWLANSENDSLQRVYGVSFPTKKELDEYITLQEEAAKRDHRRLGTAQSLYFWHPFSPGSTFFEANGSRIYNKLVEFIRSEYAVRGFTEVHSPNLYSAKLWKTSGHYAKYKDDMFMFDVEGQEFGMKPMNCPGHCLIFDHTLRSYKDLPLRFAEFGVLHRNELSGALTGLIRVRRFVQDDSHIFCRKDQISSEVDGCLDFLNFIYKILGFDYELELSTRPEKALGSEELWRSAENQLAESLNKLGKPWKINPGDGAFYGPKIDIKVFDALKRKHQCGTIQLDFNLPKRFDLQYKTGTPDKASDNDIMVYEDMTENQIKMGFDRPVIIHRAILGSLERMIAILTEQTGGKWPFWLNPKQIALLPVSEHHMEFAEKVKNRLWLEGFYADVDTASLTLNKKIRNAQVEQYNYICVIGAEEVESGSVDVRDRDSNTSIGKYQISQFVRFLKEQLPKASEARDRLVAQSYYEESVEVTQTVSFKVLNDTLERNPFVAGTEVSAEDWRISAAVKKVDPVKYPHIARWLNHLKSISS